MMRYALLSSLLLLLAACERLAGPEPDSDSLTEEPSDMPGNDDEGAVGADNYPQLIRSPAAPGVRYSFEPSSRRVAEPRGNPPELCLPDFDSR